MRSFVYAAHPARVVFGSGTLGQLRAEVERLGAARVMVVSDPGMAATVGRVAEILGPLLVARFDGVAMHTPVAVTDEALKVAHAERVDCLVSVGGGSATGLGKALSVRTGLPQIAVPSTYAGSEVTPVLGEVDGSGKTTRSAPEILPNGVLYDVDLTLGLPVGLSVTSGVNAIAHAVEALYSAGANPVTDELAVAAITRLARALPRIVIEPSDVDARSDALLGAWLAGICLGTVGMGVHHKLCHTLGGSFDLPHADTHTVILPHAMAYNAPAAPGAMARVAAALGTADAPAGMYDLIVSLEGPTSLAGLGLAEVDIAVAARAAVARPYPNPREVTVAGVEA
jgi:alcohol dehydrogenase class IV